MIEMIAKEFALNAHKGQAYGTREYSFHLQSVVSIAKELNLDENIIAACWLHDTIEDCNVSYQDIKNVCGENIAEMVYCVTDELGRNRKERKEKTYPKIKSNKEALCVKLCDRIANVQQSLIDNNMHLLSMYLKEHEAFKKALFSEDSTEPLTLLWNRLEELIIKGKEKEGTVANI